MNLHEYQAKQLFAEYGLPVSQGIAVAAIQLAVAGGAHTGAATIGQHPLHIVRDRQLHQCSLCA